MSSRTQTPRTSLTVFKRQQEFTHFAHLRLFPHTGRTHQLRVHLAEGRFPIVGDKLYGGAVSPKRCLGLPAAVQQELCSAKDTFLHAARLVLQHPLTKETLDFQAPVPSNFKRFLKTLQEQDR